MEDKLKNRVNENREEWDVYSTDLDGLWDNIESQLDQQKNIKARKTYLNWLKIAASIIIATGIGWFFAKVNNAPEHTNGYALHELSPELAETEMYYTAQINEKLEMITTSNAEVDDLVLENLALLDSAYNELKLDLKDNVDNEEVVGEMIENYRIKLELLEQILKEIKREEYEEPDEISI